MTDPTTEMLQKELALLVYMLASAGLVVERGQYEHGLPRRDVERILSLLDYCGVDTLGTRALLPRVVDRLEAAALAEQEPTDD